jgi:Na+-driven multidrug efflux pump
MYSLLMIAGGAIEASTMTFVAQNFGAGRIDRVKSGVKDGLRLAIISALVIMAVVLPFGRGILGLMVSGEPEQINAVLDIGAQQLRVMGLFLPFLYILFLFRAALQGIGNTFIPMVSGFVEAGTKVFSALVITRFFGIWGVYLSDPLGWPMATILLVIAYVLSFKKLKNQGERL